MPPAAIDEHSNTTARQYEIRSASVGQPAMETEPSARSVKSTAKQQLRLGVDPRTSIMLTVGAGALSWSHLTHIASTNGHIAPRHLLFLFPTIVDGFMVMSSGVVVRHALTDELGWRTWYAGCLVAATASLSVCLNIQDSTGRAVVPGWVLPGIAPALYTIGTELGLAELRLLMRKLRSRIRAYGLPAELATPSKKDVVLSTLTETAGHVPAALELLAKRGVSVDRSYVYEIKRGTNVGAGETGPLA